MEIWSGVTGPQGHTHEQQKIELLKTPKRSEKNANGKKVTPLPR